MTDSQRECLATFYELTKDLIYDARLKRLEAFIQHGACTRYEHCISVAYYSLIIARALRIRCDERSLVRGALLHDYFLYDWHEKDPSHRLHGFTHPSAACRNAERDFGINAREYDIIKKHMFPLTVIPPRCREGFIVGLADKLCCTYEVIASASMPRTPDPAYDLVAMQRY